MIRSLSDVLSLKFEREEIIKYLQAKEFGKERFFLALKFIYNNENNNQQHKNGLVLLKKIKALDTSELVEPSFVEEIAKRASEPAELSDSLTLLSFILDKASNRELFTMAIQKHLIYNPDTGSSTRDIENILKIIQIITYYQEAEGVLDSSQTNSSILALVKKLSEINIDRNTEAINSHIQASQEIIEFFKNRRFSHLTTYEILQLIYSIITVPKEKTVSPLVALALCVIPEDQIGESVMNLLNDNCSRKSKEIINAVRRLCEWQRYINVPLQVWITNVIETLFKNKSINILTEIMHDNIELLILSTLIPVSQGKSFYILKNMLALKIHDTGILMKVLSRSVKVLEHMKSSDSPLFEEMLFCIIDYVECYSSGSRTVDLSAESMLQKLYSMNQEFDQHREIFKYPRLSSATYNFNRKVGIENIGNTCYMNSVIQALFMTKSFSNQILKNNVNCRDIMGIQRVFAFLTFSERSYINIKQDIENIRPMDFLPGLQQDSSEFMGNLLDRIHEADKKFKMHKNGINEKSEYFEGKDEQKAEMLVNNDKFSDSTIIHEIFGGKLSTTCVCLSCNYKSVLTDSFRDLVLSFPEKEDQEDIEDLNPKICVQKLLDYYFTIEELTLDGNNQYRCENCNNLCDGTRRTELLQAPENLILTLKRFRYDPKRQMRSKLLIKRMFHNEEISLKVKENENSENWVTINYKLYAAVVHSGISLDSGHYYTFAKSQDSSWYKFNDSFVSSSDLNEFFKLDTLNTPYILFYQKISDDHSLNHHNESLLNIQPTSNPLDDKTPNFQELPPNLKHLLLEDNEKYRRENLKSSRQTDKFSNPKPWNDDDPPPSSCGSNFNNIETNRFIC